MDLVHHQEMEVNIHEAKTHFSRLLRKVASGEEVTIARAGVPVARLVPVITQAAKRPLGFDKGKVWVAEDFDAPLPDDLLRDVLWRRTAGTGKAQTAEAFVKYLLDTMVWLWSVADQENLRREAVAILQSGSEELFLSAVSSWEIAIKTQLGKYNLPEPPTSYLPNTLAKQRIRSLPVTLSHTLGVYDLPLHHRDPFDRLIIAQAIAEEMTVLTADRIFGKYPVKIVWCGK